jgi:NitT/TauT family transport system substrate-binding protein
MLCWVAPRSASRALSILHAKYNVNWRGFRDSFTPADQLTNLVVGGLPVTCNLTLPITCAARALEVQNGGRGRGATFEFSKYSGWPELKESLIAGRVHAAYMLAPLVMDLAAKQIP